MAWNCMNIGILTSSFPCHANDQAVAPFLPPFVAALQEHGVQTVVYTQDRLGPKERVVDAPVYWFPWGPGEKAVARLQPYHPLHLWRIWRLLASGIRHLPAVLQAYQIDLCLAAWTIPSGYFAYWARQKLGVPYCTWALGSDIYQWARYPGLRQLIQRILRAADGLFADGFELKSRVEHLAQKPCQFLPSLRPFPPAMHVPALPLPPTQPHFLFIGRWERVKGLDVLITAMRLLKEAKLPGHLHVLGKGSLKAFLYKQMQRYALTQHISVLEDVSTAVLWAYLRQCDCLVIPSRSDSIPLVFSEGLQAGIPMIVSAVGDLPALVRRYHLGYVVPPGDPVRLMQAMQAFVQERKKQKYCQHLAEARALFDLKRAAALFLQQAETIVTRGKNVQTAIGKCTL